MTAGPSLPFACRCGALRGQVVDAGPRAYTLVECHCADCRSAYTHLGSDDPGAVGIVQTTQDRVRIETGDDRLRCFRHTPRGALRWYADCCATPLFHTPLRARFVHVGLNADRVAPGHDLGPVVARAFVPDGPRGTRHEGAGRMVARMASRMAAKLLDGQWRGSPFFGTDGSPARVPHVLSPAERATARRRLQPRTAPHPRGAR